jgi:hypothetical protein
MSKHSDMDFGELTTDADFTSRFKNFHDSINKIGGFFDVFLAVHLSIILVINELNAQSL